MSRRARITPEQAGLPYVSGNRRVPGLRREEVAMLAGVSVEYYTRMERGKIGGVSESVLDAVAGVLRLDEDERAHLDELARNAAPMPRRRTTRKTAPISASVQQVLDSMSVPAVVQNDRLYLLAANDLGRSLYSELFATAKMPNFALYTFLDPGAERFYPQMDQAQELLVGVLRSAVGRDPFDKELTALIGELSAKSRDFAQLWARHHVQRHSHGSKRINHPIVGMLDLEYNDFALPGNPEYSITTYTAKPGSPSAERLQLLANWTSHGDAERDAECQDLPAAR